MVYKSDKERSVYFLLIAIGTSIISDGVIQTAGIMAVIIGSLLIVESELNEKLS